MSSFYEELVRMSVPHPDVVLAVFRKERSRVYSARAKEKAESHGTKDLVAEGRIDDEK